MEFDDHLFDLHDFDEESSDTDESVSSNSSDIDRSDTSSNGDEHISSMLGEAARSFFKNLTVKEKKEHFLMAFSGNSNRSHGKKERALRKMLRQVARFVDIQVRGGSRSATSRLDTGADYNFVTRDTLERCHLHRRIKRNRNDIALTLADGTSTTVRDRIELDWLFQDSDRIFQSTFFVLDDMPYDMIIGVCECIERGLITFNMPGKKFGSLTSTLSRSQKAKLSDLGRLRERNLRKRDDELRALAQSLRSSQQPGSSQRRSDRSEDAQPPLVNNFHALSIGAPQDRHHPQNCHLFLHSQRPIDYLSRTLPTQEPVNARHPSHSEHLSRAPRPPYPAGADCFDPAQGPVPGYTHSLAVFRYTYSHHSSQQPPQLSLEASHRDNQEHIRRHQHYGYFSASSVSPHDHHNRTLSCDPNPQQHPSSLFRQHNPEQNGRLRQHVYPPALHFSQSTQIAQEPQHHPPRSSLWRGLEQNEQPKQSGSPTAPVNPPAHYTECPQGIHRCQCAQLSRACQYTPLNRSSQQPPVYPPTSLQQNSPDQQSSPIPPAPSDQRYSPFQQPAATQQAASAQYIPLMQPPPPIRHQYPSQQPQSVQRASPIHRSHVTQHPRLSYLPQTFPGLPHVNQPHDTYHPDFVPCRQPYQSGVEGQ